MTVAIVKAKADHKAELKGLGFRWHSGRRNWFRFGDLDDFDNLYSICMQFWAKHPGEILFKVFNGSKPEVGNDIPF